MSSKKGISTPGMSEARRNEIEEMDQWELLELIEQVRDIVWLNEDSLEAIRLVKELVGMHEDAEEGYDDDGYDDVEDDASDEPEGLDFGDERPLDDDES